MILHALASSASPQVLLVLTGAAIGIVAGMLPGFGGPQILAILSPVIILLSKNDAVALSIGIIGAVPLSGTVPGILLNIPGHAPSVASTLDGYPLTRQGRSKEALTAAAMSAFFGALVAAIVMSLVFPEVRSIILHASFADIFAVGVLAMVVSGAAFKGNMAKGLVAAAIGLTLTFVGASPVTGQSLYTGPFVFLQTGVPLLPVLIGLFAIGEGCDLLAGTGRLGVAESGRLDAEQAWPRSKEMDASRRRLGWRNRLRSECRSFGIGSGIGTMLGVGPGVGGSITTMIAYGLVSRRKSNGIDFGEGNISGVIAPEAANNSKDPGGLITTLGLGIPTSAEMGVLLGILTIVGLNPGPHLLEQDPSELLMILYWLVMSSLVTSAIVFAMRGRLSLIGRLQKRTLGGMVLALGFIGTYFSSNIYRVDYILVAAVFGLLGYGMAKHHFPRAALVIALLVGRTVQTSYSESVAASGLHGLLSTPAVLSVMGAIGAYGAWRIVRGSMGRQRLSRPVTSTRSVLPSEVVGPVGSGGFPEDACMAPRTPGGLGSWASSAVGVVGTGTALRKRDHAGGWSDATGPLLVVYGLVCIWFVAIVAFGSRYGFTDKELSAVPVAVLGLSLLLIAFMRDMCRVREANPTGKMLMLKEALAVLRTPLEVAIGALLSLGVGIGVGSVLWVLYIMVVRLGTRSKAKIVGACVLSWMLVAALASAQLGYLDLGKLV